MNKYKLNKRYILKMIIARSIVLIGINLLYLKFYHKIPMKLLKISFVVLQLINVIGLLMIFIMPFIEYLSYSYMLDFESVEIKCGVLFRKTICIPRAHIKYIIIQKDPLDRLLQISNLKLYTTAGDRVIRALGKDRVIELWNIMKDEANI